MTQNPYLATIEAALNSVPLAWVLCFLIAALVIVKIARWMIVVPDEKPSASRAVVIDHDPRD